MIGRSGNAGLGEWQALLVAMLTANTLDSFMKVDDFYFGVSRFIVIPALLDPCAVIGRGVRKGA